jgi:hypothetical protein
MRRNVVTGCEIAVATGLMCQVLRAFDGALVVSWAGHMAKVVIAKS